MTIVSFVLGFFGVLLIGFFVLSVFALAAWIEHWMEFYAREVHYVLFCLAVVVVVLLAFVLNSCTS